jgi:S-DNA-T family DNA segregation ATPase FtsK/SpoIIIE
VHVDGVDRRIAALYAVAAALAAACAAMVGDPRLFGPWQWWWPMAAGVACAAASVPTPLRRRARLAAVVRAVCWLAAGGWVAVGYREGIWSGGYWQAWAYGALGLGVLASVFATPTDWGEPMFRLAPAPPARSEWADRIAQVAKIAGVRSVTVRAWDAGAGYRVAGEFAGDGTTWRDLQRFEAALAAHLRLPKGCGVEVGPGEHRGGFTIDVATQDAMAASREYPG